MRRSSPPGRWRAGGRSGRRTSTTCAASSRVRTRPSTPCSTATPVSATRSWPIPAGRGRSGPCGTSASSSQVFSPSRGRPGASPSYRAEGSPTALAPLVEFRTFLAHSRRVTVSGQDHGVIGELAEDPLLEVVHERGEVRLRPGLARPAGEERVTGEEDRSSPVAQQQRDRTGGVPAQADRLEDESAEVADVEVVDGVGDLHAFSLGDG